MQILLGKSAFATALPAALDPFLASILMVESLSALNCPVWACSRREIEVIYIVGLVLLCITHSEWASTKPESDLGQIKDASWCQSEATAISGKLGFFHAFAKQR